jgi:hypothetical protein
LMAIAKVIIDYFKAEEISQEAAPT